MIGESEENATFVVVDFTIYNFRCNTLYPHPPEDCVEDCKKRGKRCKIY